jgi:hypothetical protein
MNFEPTLEEAVRIIARKQFIIDTLVGRTATLIGENMELLSIVQEIQRDLAEARQLLAELQESEQLLFSGPDLGRQEE